MTTPRPHTPRNGSIVRVLYCIDSLAAGGTERQLLSLIAGLDRSRFEPFVCTVRPSEIPLSTLPCRSIELSLGSFASWSAVQSTRQLRRFLIDERIDVVHTFFQDSTVLAACASLGTPVRALVASFRDLGFWRSPKRVWPLRLSYRRFTGFTANARAVAAHINALDGIPLDSIEIIYNGVTLPPARAPRATTPTVGIVANLNRPVKRVDLFLDAAKLVADRVPGARFVVVGDGPLRADLERQAQRLGIADAVTFAGSAGDVSRWIDTFSVGVLTSDSEGFSNAILEYMAGGVPTVARRVGGNVELVIDGVTGLLAEGDTAADIGAAVVRLLENDIERSRMGMAARRTVQTRYSMEACVRRHEAYYDRLLQRRPRLEEAPNHDAPARSRAGRPAKPLVSVIVATYNCGRFITQAVDSVLAQTYPSVEVHVVNDGSTDNTAEIMARYRNDPRVLYHEQTNQGQTIAKNRGIREARGEFIAFCDADDLWLPDKLTLEMPGFQHSDRIGVVYSGITCITEDGKPLDIETPADRGRSGNITVPLFKTNIIPFGTAVVRRSCLTEMGPFDERLRMGIDWELWLRLSTRFEFLYIDTPTYVYRVWGGQMSRNWRGRYEAAFQIMREFIARNPSAVPPEAVRDAWADSYAQRARLRAHLSGEYLAAFGDIARAIVHKPALGLAWKSIGYVLSTAAGRRSA